MARIPHGGELIVCEVSIAPGFRIENVYAMAGIPRIMQAQFDTIEPTLKGGPPILSRRIRCNLREGDIAFELADIQKSQPKVDIGSYPHYGETPSLSLVLRGTDEAILKSIEEKIVAMILSRGDTPIF
jgi:molybdopterin-biosynthesis enzyme MoeA-like protein